MQKNKSTTKHQHRTKHAIKTSCKKQLTITKAYASRSCNIKNTKTKQNKKVKSFQKLEVLQITRKEGEKDVQRKRGNNNNDDDEKCSSHA
jgi:hypothetical protein